MSCKSFRYWDQVEGVGPFIAEIAEIAVIARHRARSGKPGSPLICTDDTDRKKTYRGFRQMVEDKKKASKNRVLGCVL